MGKAKRSHIHQWLLIKPAAFGGLMPAVPSFAVTTLSLSSFFLLSTSNKLLLLNFLQNSLASENYLRKQYAIQEGHMQKSKAHFVGLNPWNQVMAVVQFEKHQQLKIVDKTWMDGF